MCNLLKHRLLPILAFIVSRSLLTVLLVHGATASAGVLHVAIDTSRFSAARGYVDMQLSASAGVPLATAVVSNMVGFDSNADVESWGVTTIPGRFVFRNDTSNDLFHAVDFGGVLSFDLSFSGEIDPLTTYVSHFVVSAFDDAYGLLGNHDPLTGALVDFSWTPGINAQMEGSVGILVSDAAVTVVPEPSAWFLLIVGLAAIGRVRKIKRSMAR